MVLLRTIIGHKKSTQKEITDQNPIKLKTKIVMKTEKILEL